MFSNNFLFSFVNLICINDLIINSLTKAEQNSQKPKPPHIIFILADDLGFNDVGFHGSAEIPTPNIDALAYSGLILNRYYVNPICTPSRSALMTGKYPIHTGLQHGVIYGTEPRGLPLEEKLMPQYFNELGSHIVGKWHLGHWKREYTPLYRGFRSHVGFWTGHQDYFDHTAHEQKAWGMDMRNGLEVGYQYHGQYITDVITDEAIKIIQNHTNHDQPLFLYVAHAAVHSGNPYNPLSAPDEIVEKMSHISDYKRRKYAAMVFKLDESVGRIVQQLEQHHLLNDSIIVFSTDNGGPAEGFNLNRASNWPLRGVKATLWEGGVRGVGVLWAAREQFLLSRVAQQYIHIVDWLPTLLAAAGTTKMPSNLDGRNLWSSLIRDEKSPRQVILHNIDSISNTWALTSGDWKIIKGSYMNGSWDGWYGPSGNRDPSLYDYNQVMNSMAGKSLKGLNLMPSKANMVRLRRTAADICDDNSQVNAGSQTGRENCIPQEKPCLFNIQKDPCERQNVISENLNIYHELLDLFEVFNKSAKTPNNQPPDNRGLPCLWNYTWTNFGDYIQL